MFKIILSLLIIISATLVTYSAIHTSLLFARNDGNLLSIALLSVWIIVLIVNMRLFYRFLRADDPSAQQ